MTMHDRHADGAAPPVTQPVLAAIEEIGRDHAMTPAELSPAVRGDAATIRIVWTAYERHWARFCGARLDPQFWRLDHPARWSGAPRAVDRSPAIVVGTGPSLRQEIATLRRLREQVHLITSPRGADALLDAGITPDVVVVEHQTPLDAHFSVQELSQGAGGWRFAVPLIVTDDHTPAALLAGVPPERLLVLEPRATWSLWPATAVALALGSGAPLVGLLGIDLGGSRAPDPRQRPLLDLLGLMTVGASASTVDFATDGARKAGWRPASIEEALAAPARQPLSIVRAPWRAPDERRAAARASWRRLLPQGAEAAAALRVAGRVRDGARDGTTIARLTAHLDQLLDWGADLQCRIDVQDGLGCAFLPRFWRTPPDRSLGPLLWRPVALAAHELMHQHGALRRYLHQQGMA